MTRTEAIDFANRQVKKANDLSDRGQDDLALASAALALLALETHGIKFCVKHWQITNDGGDCRICKAINELKA